MADDDLERRLTAVERAVDADDAQPTIDREERTDRADLDERLTTLETRVEELDAALQAVRGFLGGVSAVNESVERRADAAVAAVERLEARIDDGDEAGIGVDQHAGVDADDEASDPDEAAEPDPATEGRLRDRLRDLR